MASDPSGLRWAFELRQPRFCRCGPARPPPAQQVAQVPLSGPAVLPFVGSCNPQTARVGNAATPKRVAQVPLSGPAVLPLVGSCNPQTARAGNAATPKRVAQVPLSGPAVLPLVGSCNPQTARAGNAATPKQVAQVPLSGPAVLPGRVPGTRSIGNAATPKSGSCATKPTMPQPGPKPHHVPQVPTSGLRFFQVACLARGQLEMPQLQRAGVALQVRCLVGGQV